MLLASIKIPTNFRDKPILMDLTLFHPKNRSRANLKIIDRWNNYKGYVNRQLLHEGSDILQQFLMDAEQDFDKAFLTAIAHINEARFPYAHLQPPPLHLHPESTQRSHQRPTDRLHHLPIGIPNDLIHPSRRCHYQRIPTTIPALQRNIYLRTLRHPFRT